ncbi:hypothetical protein Q8A67_022310 [Cirrhinus molitorella]|uniref:Uncharacterized protein n=1 Tax=Cirrhinus molitorella TaxID=172907 RepID=A0AA88P6B4_9TELE|nr:hypothetical protein Q8A67_022310 [Cirrhinus molitorella]
MEKAGSRPTRFASALLPGIFVERLMQDMHTAAQGGRGQCSDEQPWPFVFACTRGGGGGRADETLAQDCNQLLQPKKTNRFEQRERNRQKGEVEKENEGI